MTVIKCDKCGRCDEEKSMYLVNIKSAQYSGVEPDKQNELVAVDLCEECFNKLLEYVSSQTKE
jgi:Zn-dependent alcohol dehydrogenase